MYRHQTLRINYTTYDMRHAQDSINPRTRPDIMMYAPSSHHHLYLYARVLGVFHVKAYRAGDDPTGVDDSDVQNYPVLWVRWLDLDTTKPGGFKTCRLPRLKWAAQHDSPYGFLAPDDVLRAAHLIPAFAYGMDDKPAVHSDAQSDDEMDIDLDGADDDDDDIEEWKYHYVNMYVLSHANSQAASRSPFLGSLTATCS